MNSSANENNGLITKIWGPPLWTGLHCITFGYPINPTEEQKEKYKEFFTLVGDILPCKYCRESYKNFITTGNTKLTEEVLENRDTFTKWFYRIHEAVNKKLGVYYGVSYEDVAKRYESYRATCSKDDHNTKGCIVPLDSKAQSYKMSEIKECPIIPVELAKEFIPYAKLRGFSEKDFLLVRKYKNNRELTKALGDKCSDEWCSRNKLCAKVISKMRREGIPAIEESGEWKGLPTPEELKLILNFSSTLDNEELVKLLNKLPSKKRGHKKIYKLVV